MKLVAILFAIILILVVLVVYFLLDRLRRRRFYHRLEGILQQLDQKFLLTDLIDRPETKDGASVYDLLAATDQYVAERVRAGDQRVRNFRDYIELWVHEIKTPLASLMLSGDKLTREQRIALDAIGNYIDQALFYAKLGAADQDFVIKPVKLEALVNTVIRVNKDALIKHKIKITTHDLNHQIASDPKWLAFILNQIVLNAIKYRADRPQIEFRFQQDKQAGILTIRDHGIGIKSSELPRVLDKGFTGSNGRRQKSATGMGLYIADQLARSLGHQLSIDSVEDQWTAVSLTFGRDRLLNLA